MTLPNYRPIITPTIPVKPIELELLDLPVELIYKFTAFLDADSLRNLLFTNCFLYGLSQDLEYWYGLFENEFGIQKEAFTIFDNQLIYSSRFFDSLYRRVQQLVRNINHLADKNSLIALNDSANHSSILAVCSDDLPYIHRYTPANKLYRYYIPLFAGCAYGTALYREDTKSNTDHLNLAVKTGNLSHVKFLLNPANQFYLTINHNLYDDSLFSGNMQVVRFLEKLEPNLKRDDFSLNKATASGNLETFDYAYSINPDSLYYIRTSTSTFLCNAARGGNVEIIKRVIALNPNVAIDNTMLNLAAKSGNVSCVEILLAANPELLPRLLGYLNAIESGNIALVRLLLKLANITVTSTVVTGAVKIHHLPLVLLLNKNQNGEDVCSPTQLLNMACEHHFYRLAHLALNKMPNEAIGIQTLYILAATGNLPLVKAALEKNPALKPDQATFEFAVKAHQSLALVRYLLTMYPRLEITIPLIWSGIQQGEDGLAELLLAKNESTIPDNNFKQFYTGAVVSGKLPLLRYLFEQKLPSQDTREELFLISIQFESTKVTKLILSTLPENYQPSFLIIGNCVISGSVNMVDFCIKRFNFQPDELCVNYAVSVGSAPLVKYLLSNFTISVTSEMMEALKVSDKPNKDKMLSVLNEYKTVGCCHLL